jgi:TonB family protein
MQAKWCCRLLARTRVVVATQCIFLFVLIAVGFRASVHGQDANHRKILSRVNPEYPDTLRMAQIGGLVRLNVTVSPGGTVTQAEVRGGNPILAEKAQQAVMKWKFAPGPAQTVEEIRISFSPH